MKGARMVYIWQWPVRFFHWVNALCIVILFLTGLYIGWPLLHPAGEAYRNFTLGWVRYIHFVTAYIFLANWIFRIYWFFVGNEHSKNIFRFWSRHAWRSVGQHLRAILTASPDVRQELPGENQLARLMHGLLFTVSVFMLLSGFALYGEADPTGLPARLTTWVIGLFGGTRPLHYWHHLAAWFFPLFVIAHLYQVFRTDILARQGLVSSMITGYYFCSSQEAEAAPAFRPAAGE